MAKKNHFTFRLKPEKGWKQIPIFCKFFKTSRDYERYVLSVMSDIERIEGPAITIGWGKKANKPTGIELCFCCDFFSWLIASHELTHLALAYSRATKTPRGMSREEWLCDINSWFSALFVHKFNLRFKTDPRIGPANK